jgi:ketosteroid isomerase-like protein
MLKTISLAVLGILFHIPGILFAESTLAIDPQKTVMETERAFAATMADRDFEKFKTFISEEAIFFSGEKPLRGRQQIADAWEGFFKEATAPFSWEPEQVEVLDSGKLAWSTGPVYGPEGKQVARFNSVWQLDASQQWRIIFDKGSDVCNCP